MCILRLYNFEGLDLPSLDVFGHFGHCGLLFSNIRLKKKRFLHPFDKILFHLLDSPKTHMSIWLFYL